MKSKTVSVSLSSEIWDEIDKMDIPISKLIRTAIVQFLSKPKEEIKAVTETAIRAMMEFYRPLETQRADVLEPLRLAFSLLRETSIDYANKDRILQIGGTLLKFLESVPIYHRPIAKDTNVPSHFRQEQELLAVEKFSTIVVEEIFNEMCEGSAATLAMNEERIKSGFFVCYHNLSKEDDNASI